MASRPGDTEKLIGLALASVEGLRSLAYAAGGATQEVAGTLCWFSSSFIPLFNGASLLSSALINEDTLRSVDYFFLKHPRPYTILTMDELVPTAQPQLFALEYVPYDTYPAMVLDGAPKRWRYGPMDLSIRLAATRQDLAHYRRILGQVFVMPQREIELVMGDKVLEAEHVRSYLAVFGDVPVGTATVVLDGTMAGIWNVGVLPEYRRHGVAAELMHFALSEARLLGYESSMLLATPAGVPLYERLGYVTRGTVRIFVHRRQAGR